MLDTISRCCPVRQTRVSWPGRPRSSRMTGASLIASGRVPRTTRILLFASTECKSPRLVTRTQRKFYGIGDWPSRRGIGTRVPRSRDFARTFDAVSPPPGMPRVHPCSTGIRVFVRARVWCSMRRARGRTREAGVSQMQVDATGPRRAKVCMLAYVQAPSWYPPMVHEAHSLAAAGYDVEALCPAPTPDVPLLEEHAPGFRTRRFRVRVRSFFRVPPRPRSPEPGGRGAAVPSSPTPSSFPWPCSTPCDRAPRSTRPTSCPRSLPALLAAKLRGRPIVYRAHEIWSETRAKVPFAWFWRRMDRMLVPHCDQVVTPEENRSRIYEDEFGARRRPMTVRNCPPFRPPVQSTRLREELARRGTKRLDHRPLPGAHRLAALHRGDRGGHPVLPARAWSS